MEEKYKDLTVKGLYYFPKLNEGLKKFQNRIPHDMLVIDGDFCSSDELEKNIIRLPNRIIILKKENKNYLPDSSALKNKIVEIDLKKEWEKLSNKWKELVQTNQENEIDYLYFLLRILWIKNFFKVNNKMELFLLNLNNENQWSGLSSKSALLNLYCPINYEISNVLEAMLKDKNAMRVIFDHHSSLLKKIGGSIIGGMPKIDEFFENKVNYLYYEAWGIDSYLSFIFNISPTNEMEIIQKIIELLEAGLTKVIVIDERIAEKAVEKRGLYIFGKQYKIWQILRARQIYIVSHFKNDFNEIPISPNIKEKAFTLEIKNDGLYFDSTKLENFHFLIIHKTILGNKQFKNYLNIENNDYNKWVEKIEKYVPFVIIDSGRGEVDIPEKAKFLPYSYLEEVLIEKPNKYNLTKYLWRLTRLVEEAK